MNGDVFAVIFEDGRGGSIESVFDTRNEAEDEMERREENRYDALLMAGEIDEDDDYEGAYRVEELDEGFLSVADRHKLANGWMVPLAS